MNNTTDTPLAGTDLTLHELTDLYDPALPRFTDLLQTLFPPDEQVLVSEVLTLLQQRGEAAEGGADDEDDGEEGGSNHLLTAHDPEGEVAAMLWYQRLPASPEAGLAAPLAILWYIGVAAERQSRGYGGHLYREVCRRVFEEGDALLVMEVERVDKAAKHSPERARDAERRLRFYQEKQGALLLEGIEYVQSTGWQPDLPMHLLVQPNPNLPRPLDAHETFDLLKAVFGDSLSRIAGAPLALAAPAPER